MRTKRMTISPKNDLVYQPSSKKSRTTALIMLLIMCFFWGTTFPLMKWGVAIIEEDYLDSASKIGPIVFLAMRYALAALILPFFLLLEKRGGKRLSGRAVKFSAILCLLFLSSMYLQVYGLRLITPAVSAFVTNLTTVFVPLVMWIILRKPPAGRVAIAALVAFIGVGLISYVPDESLIPAGTVNDVYLGVGLTVGCAIIFALFIIYTDYATKREDPIMISILVIAMSAVGAIMSLVVVADLGPIVESLPAMLSDYDLMMPVVVTAVFATAYATYAWNRWQRELSPSRAAVLYTTEPVFTLIISVSIGEDDLRTLLVIGGLCIIVANIWCERGFPRPKELEEFSPRVNVD